MKTFIWYDRSTVFHDDSSVSEREFTYSGEGKSYEA